MHIKIRELLLNKEINIPSIMFYNLEKLDITYEEFYYLIYFLNNNSKVFDMSKVCADLSKKPKSVLQVINDLDEKKLIKLEIVKEEEAYESISLNGLIDKLVFLIIEKEETKEQQIDLINEIEKIFKRNLISREKQIVKTWKMVGYSEEFILHGVKEAEYNKEYSIAYIDTILDNWNNQGLKTVEEINSSKTINAKNVELDLPNIEIDEGFNWMDE